MSDAAESARVRSLRPPKPRVDAWSPLDVLVEEERLPDGTSSQSMTVFLAGSECPFTCVYCDLWQYTLDGPTPAGAIPRQLEIALADVDRGQIPHSIKLYNASNFFDSRAVPAEDLEAIAGQLEIFRQVIVECHPRLVGQSCFRFAELLAGDLEVAMGLETIHPLALPRLNKEMSLSDFEDAVNFLGEHGIGARAFVLLSPPYVRREESVDWTIRTVEFASRRGVEVISIIPLRGGTGEMTRLASAGQFEPPTLDMLEEALAGSLSLCGGVVLADLWDVESMGGCPDCQRERIEHLREMNRTGVAKPVVWCDQCSSSKQGDT